tara:strand:+ start:11428 stop:11970 length:543 start_codon:yes stop_codon:yes gene_type:complete
MSNWADSTTYQNQLNQGFKFGKWINPGQIQSIMKPTQDIISNITNTGQELMDPNSSINARFRRIMEQRASQSAAEQMQNAKRIAAQTGMSSGQAMMNAQIGQNRAMGDVNQQWQSGLDARFSQGLGAMQSMGQMQQGLGSMFSNAYLARLKQNKEKDYAAAAKRNLGNDMWQSMFGLGQY